MTYPSAEEPKRPDDGEATEVGATADTAATTEKEDPAGLSDAGTVAVLDEPGAAPLSEKPVLEWTTEDWARWIEEPALLVPPDEEPAAAAAEAAPAPLPDLSEEEVDDRIEGDPTATWTLPPDEDDDDAKWWSTVAGLPDPATPPAPPAPPVPLPPPPPPPEVAPVPETPPPQPPENEPPFLPPPPGSQPPVLTPPPLASSLPLPVLPPPPPLPTPEVPLPVGVPTVTEPRREPPEAAPRRPQPPRPRPEVAAPSRSPQPHRISLEPVDSVAVRIRAGLSLLGVSVLVGAVSAGLITVAIFMASVVLRRALG